MDMADRLKKISKEKDILCRMTQDKFIVILSAERELVDLDGRAEQFAKDTRMDWKCGKKEYLISTTIGVSIYLDSSKDFLKQGNSSTRIR